jgi:hypothetical protein
VTPERVTGTYLLGLEPLIVDVYDDGLVLAGLGVPREFAARIVSAGEALRVEGGPLDGADVVFADGDPCPGGVLGGFFEFTRAPAGSSLPGGRGLLAPPLDLSSDEVARYRELLDAIEHDPDGGWLELGERPRWRFVEWLTCEARVIFHGSPKPDIEVFRPVRSSVELMDQRGTGNLAAVYGTSYGLWAMWFAVLDRSRLQGSIRNGVIRWTDRSGRPLDVYHFSVHHEHVGGDIWHPGTLYLLPRRSFRPNSFLPGGPPTGEWASPEEVEPLKRVAVDPDDFPFLEQVGGHDDAELIRAEELSDVVLGRVRSARRIPGGLELTLEWDDRVAEVFDDYLAMARRFTPDTERRLTRVDAEDAVLEVSGAAGVLQALAGSLEERGVPVD